MTQTDELTGTFGDEDEADHSYADADSLLGAAIPAVTWPEIGAGVTGTILAVDTSTQTDPDGNVKTFANGDVRRQVILTLQTTSKEGPGDDGRRRLFVKGSMVKSFREAIAAAKAPGPRIGGSVTVVYSSDGKVTGRGLNPPKLFTVEYKAPK
jgi:hypothetical protein